MRLFSLSTHTAETLQFSDTPVHIHVHVVTMHKYKIIDGTQCECTTNYGFTHVSFVQNVAHMRCLSSRACEFLNRENFC